MREIIASPEKGEPVIDKQLLAETVDELLDEADWKEAKELNRGFPWQVIFLYKEKYKEKTGIKSEALSTAEFYGRLNSKISELLAERRRPVKPTVKYSKMDASPAADEITPRWLSEETAREERNETPPRFTV